MIKQMVRAVIAGEMTPTERAIASAEIPDLINAYMLIAQKQSKLSSRQRDLVCMRVHYMLEKGELKLEEVPSEETEVPTEQPAAPV